MIQHELIKTPSTYSSFLPQGLTRSALLQIDVDSARRDRAASKLEQRKYG